MTNLMSSEAVSRQVEIVELHCQPPFFDVAYHVFEAGLVATDTHVKVTSTAAQTHSNYIDEVYAEVAGQLFEHEELQGA